MNKKSKFKMFSKFTSIFQQAVEALAPTLPLQEDFIYHWKAITHYFIENKDDKAHIEHTNLPAHMDQMLEILLQEERGGEEGSTGTCMEYMLQHKILETLYTLCRTDSPPGMKQKVLVFFTHLLSKIRQPLLPHISVHRAVHRMIRVCGEVRAAPTENEEIIFLCTVCAKLRQDPYLVNFFLENPSSTVKLVSPGVQAPSPASNKKPEFNMVDSLLVLTQSADERIAVKACEGLMLCASLPEASSANCIVNNTKFLNEMSEKLCKIYKALPDALDPADIELTEAKWGLDSVVDHSEYMTFAGKRKLVSLLSWLDYCDQLIAYAHPDVGAALSRAIREKFLQQLLEPAILQACEAGSNTATALLNRCLRLVASTALLQEFVYFIVGEERGVEEPGPVSHKLKGRLLERFDHLSEELSITTLKLFETLLLKPSEHLVHNLVLRNVLGRCYHDNSAIQENHLGNGVPNVSNGPVSPVEPKDLDPEDILGDEGVFLSPDSPRAADKKEVHKIVNCFLNLVPEDARSSYQMADSGYDTYLTDAHKQFADAADQCRVYKWPSSPASNPAYVTENFYEGSFLKALFDRLSHMVDQSYDINLQVTSVVSKLALLAHPNLDEFLLDPLLPTKSGTRTLNAVFLKVVSDIDARMKTTPDFQRQLLAVRKQLMGISSDFRNIEDHSMLEGVIVLEEFCKELAAIAFVKHHASAAETTPASLSSSR